MSFLDNLEKQELCEPYVIDGNYEVEQWIYVDPDTDQFYKAKIIKPFIDNKNNLIKELWLNEVRQLNKLKSVTNANKFLELIDDSFIEEGNYCLTYLTNDTTTSLKSFIENKETIQAGKRISLKRNKHWITEEKIFDIRSRIFLWKNILRLVEAVDILHSHDIVHRNISIDGILYDADESLNEDERFVLSGFEKSFDFNKLNNVIHSEKDGTVFSTQQDWYDLCTLILELFRINKEDYLDKQFTISERKLIEKLLKADVLYSFENLISAKEVKQALNNIVYQLSIHETQLNQKLYITTFKRDSANLESLKSKVKNLIIKNESNDKDLSILSTNDFYAFITDDLNVEFFEIFHNHDSYYLLKGRKGLYSFRKFDSEKFPNWTMAFINEIYEGPPNWLNYKQKIKIHTQIQFVANPFTLNNFELEDENSWELIISQFNREKKFSDRELHLLQGLLLSLAVEIGLVEAESYLVKVNKLNNDSKYTSDDANLYYYSIEFKDSKRNKDISNALNINEPYTRFKNHFQSDNPTESWFIEPNKSRDELESKDRIKLTFIEISYQGHYIFASETDLNFELEDFSNSKATFRFYPLDNLGSHVLASRKISVFSKLLEHSTLLSSLSTPTDKLSVSRRIFDVYELQKNFDDSKKEVFNALIKTYPNFVIEGPPGVGKTFLITSYVSHLFKEERSTKVLLSAQAHATVKILYESVISLFKEYNMLDDLIIIKNFNDYSFDEEKINYNLETCKPYLTKFKQSKLYKANTSDATIRKKLNEFINEPNWDFFKKILKAADLVFTTSNSKLMADLIQDEIGFNVSIIEESAKASALELISPMLVSNKRVMIGDYKQLPAFHEKNIKDFLHNQKDVDINILVNLLEDYGLRGSVKYELDIKQQLASDKQEVFKNMHRYFSLFKYLSKEAQSLVERRQPSFGNLLSIQHRMHPEISRLVSHAVYNDKLKTDIKKINFFQKTKPFFFKGSMLGELNIDKAIIWIDIPEKYSGNGIESFEENYINNAEVNIIEEILSKIECKNGQQYKLRVLSPYSKQVKLLNKSIDKTIVHDCFSNSISYDIASTVDSFQGNEADLIIISLVRHNSKPTLKSALGFLSDMRRMNVLLSRAKYKMIIVGCFGLFKRWLELDNEETTNERGYLAEDDREFLKKFVNFCEKDFELMQDSLISSTENRFNNIGFVSAKDFLEL